MKRFVLFIFTIFTSVSCSFPDFNSTTSETNNSNDGLSTPSNQDSSIINEPTTSDITIEPSNNSSNDDISSISSSISVAQELLSDTDFVSLDKWTIYPSDDTMKVLSHGNGELELLVDNSSASEYWSNQVLQNNLNLDQNNTYDISFKIKSSVERDIRFLIQSMDYSTMAYQQDIHLSAGQEYNFSVNTAITVTTSYLYGFMLGNVNGVLSSSHTITISNPSLQGKKTSPINSIGLDGTYDAPSNTHGDKTLVWNEEFNGTCLDSSKWSYEIGRGDWGWGNNEQQYYTNRSDNLEVSNGSLKIIAKKENYQNAEYTSARIITRGKYSFKYGYIETRLAAPSLNGIWPAFWMLGDSYITKGWPYCGEIDLMEAINYNNEVYSTLHWNQGSITGSYNPVEKGDHCTIDDRTQYHIYGYEWDSDSFKAYVDNQLFFHIVFNDDAGKDCFKENFYFLLNVAVGGQWPGYNIGDTFPQYMSVDYIRVYQ